MATRQEREAKRRAHEAEIRKKLEEVNAKKDPNAPHKGRSSTQGVSGYFPEEKSQLLSI